MDMMWLSVLLLGISPARQAPNIVFILADDLGWYDVGFHGSDIQTPNIDKLAQEGVILDNYYVQPMCTPTRGSLLTGKYPIHTGLQHYVILGASPYGLPLTEVTLAQHLKTLGYSTHVVGKWHLGFCSKEYLPENRGFDSHVGYYVGLGDYFSHYAQEGEYAGYDFHHNGQPLWNQTDVYSTEIFTTRAEAIIKSHNKSQPLFLYLAHQAVHAGNENDPIQAPQKYVDRFPYIKNLQRRMFAGNRSLAHEVMSYAELLNNEDRVRLPTSICVSRHYSTGVVAALDDSVGAVYTALEESGLLDNTIIIFSSDNGGPANGMEDSASSNWPLRGSKRTLWQGGVRGVGLINSALLQKQGYINSNLMHVVDWLPTIYSLAGGSMSDMANIDGIEQMDVMLENATTTRQEVLLNIDPLTKNEALILGDYKLISGDISGGKYDGWYPPPEVSENVYLFDQSKNSRGCDQVLAHKTLLVKCGQKPSNASENCHPEKSACLFNLKDDPCEYNNLAASLPSVVAKLQERIDAYRSTMIAPVNKPIDPASNPQLHGGVWQPWL